MDRNAESRKGPDWVLCPSKTFSGKFYYFNVSNGEAVWSSNGAEKQFQKNPLIRNVEESHSHPEPTITPEDETPHAKIQSTNPPSVTLRETSNNTTTTTTTNNSNTNARNTTHVGYFLPPNAQIIPIYPVKIPLPNFRPDTQSGTPHVYMIMLDQDGPPKQPATSNQPPQLPTTSAEPEQKEPEQREPEQTVPNPEIIVHTTNETINQRFNNYRKEILSLNKSNEKPAVNKRGWRNVNHANNYQSIKARNYQNGVRNIRGHAGPSGQNWSRNRPQINTWINSTSRSITAPKQPTPVTPEGSPTNSGRRISNFERNPQNNKILTRYSHVPNVPRKKITFNTNESSTITPHKKIDNVDAREDSSQTMDDSKRKSITWDRIIECDGVILKNLFKNQDETPSQEARSNKDSRSYDNMEGGSRGGNRNFGRRSFQ